MFVSHQGEGSRLGQRHLFVRFAGCNMRCSYCDTPDSLVRVADCCIDFPDGRTEKLKNPISVGDLASLVNRWCEIDPTIAMIAITGGEPLVQAPFLAHWLNQHPPPLPCLLETNATIAKGLDEILGHVEVVSADLKLSADTSEPDRWSEHREFLRRCARSDAEVYVKMPVGPKTDREEVRRGARLVATTIPRATLFLQPITDTKTGAWEVSESGLFSLLAVASAEQPRSRLRPQIHKLVGMR